MRTEDRPTLLLITAPPPTPNGPLHVGHLSGPYVAADVAARAARARGTQVLTLSGLDTHQNYVLTKAAALALPVEDAMRGYARSIRETFQLAHIDYDVFLDPADDAEYRGAVADLMAELVDRGAVALRDTTLLVCRDCGRTLHHGYVSGACQVCGQTSGGGTCEGCGSFTTAGSLGAPRCSCCGGEPRTTRMTVPLLRLEEHRQRLVEVWAGAELPPRLRRLLRRYLDEGLPDVPLAYPTDWGIELRDPIPSGQRADVWAEMGVGYLYAVARALDPSARGVERCAAAWNEVGGMWHFFGIDNAFYYAVLFPAIFAAAGVPSHVLSGVIMNEFYRLDGLKFSTSRNHAVWAQDLLSEEDAGIVRLYLCYDRPDSYESDFTYEGFHTFRDHVLRRRREGGRAESVALDRLDLVRAGQALRLQHFDPALAVRCLLPSVADDSDDARALLSALTGGDAVPSRARGTGAGT